MLNTAKIDQAVIRIHALAHALRIKIVLFLQQTPDAQVKDIYHALDIEQSVCSQHLKILRDAEIVTFERFGKEVRYNINYPIVSPIIPALEKFLEEE